MSAIKKPVAALLGVLAMLVAGLMFTAVSSQAYPVGTAATCELSNTTPKIGGSETISCQNFQPGETVGISLHSATYSLGSAVADGSGSFTTVVGLPAGVSGEHDVVMTGLSSGDVVSIGIDIGGTGGGSGSGSGGLSGTGVAVVGIGALGVVLLVGGGLLLMAGRRRKISV